MFRIRPHNIPHKEDIVRRVTNFFGIEDYFLVLSSFSKTLDHLVYQHKLAHYYIVSFTYVCNHQLQSLPMFSSLFKLIILKDFTFKARKKFFPILPWKNFLLKIFQESLKEK